MHKDCLWLHVIATILTERGETIVPQIYLQIFSFFLKNYYPKVMDFFTVLQMADNDTNQISCLWRHWKEEYSWK